MYTAPGNSWPVILASLFYWTIADFVACLCPVFLTTTFEKIFQICYFFTPHFLLHFLIKGLKNFRTCPVQSFIVRISLYRTCPLNIEKKVKPWWNRSPAIAVLMRPGQQIFFCLYLVRQLFHCLFAWVEHESFFLNLMSHMYVYPHFCVTRHT